MYDLVFVLFLQLQAGREVTQLKWPFQPNMLSLTSFWWIRRSVSWEKRSVKVVGVAPVKLLDEVRERFAALLQIDRLSMDDAIANQLEQREFWPAACGAALFPGDPRIVNAAGFTRFRPRCVPAAQSDVVSDDGGTAKMCCLFGRRIYARRHKISLCLINQRVSLVHLVLMQFPTARKSIIQQPPGRRSLLSTERRIRMRY